MAAVVNTVQVTASDRLGFSLFFATILHAMVILGIGFGIHFSNVPNRSSMLEVTMVLTKTHQQPEEAEHIASENQLASGSTDLTNQPSSPIIGSSLLDTRGLAPVQMSPSQPSPADNKVQQEIVFAQEATQSMQEVEQQKQKVEERTGRQGRCDFSQPDIA